MQNSFTSSKFKLGILGGGQLGRMFIQESVNYNLDVHILDPDPNAPCKNIATTFQNGDLKDFDAVYNFGKDKDLITIEIEHVNTDALQKLEDEGIKVFPQPSILKMIQDKGLQKEFYAKHQIPTSDYYLVEDKAGIQQYVDEFPFMQKMRKGGYDGKGVTPLKDPAQLDNAFDAPSVLEKFVDFDKEISVIVARNENGEVKSYPVVELEFDPVANLVDFLFAPANVAKEIEAKAREIAENLVEKTQIVGLLAVEMFVTKDGQVLVNEIAPRTHNSGHQSIEGNVTSQFEQHMRSVLNLPLGDTRMVEPSVMVNLLGEQGYDGEAKYEGLKEVLEMPGVHIHLYGKKFTRPYRKMGHVTIGAETLETAKEIALKVKNTLKVIA
ncbi:5-(carboxyamino)imidazole ribonucleotide synthase [bacterium SCSIO 12643]|nr:5-(carboxyamino)imidazole ribonucleotide synthase [bacterium SCSIO 12643]